MRLGLLGPARGDVAALERAARFLVEQAAVDRAVYLWHDGALDEAIRRWAVELVDDRPEDHHVLLRAARSCARGDAAGIRRFVDGERKRQRLKVLESLPTDRVRVVELIDGQVLVMIDDKAGLDEEDMLPATYLAWGRSNEPVVRRIGSRWFLAPGALPDAGVLVLDDGGPEVRLTVHDASGKALRSEVLTATRAASFRVTSGPR